MIFPWQEQQWQQLSRAKQEGRLPHALLFVGIKGTGKAQFAEYFIRSQLCTAECKVAAKGCHSCRLIAGKAHPNVLWIEPEKEGGAIKIDQVREVAEFVNQTSLQGEYRYILINPANNMNINAANALLKTLEEPSSGSIMILISEQASHLPATVLSRCQHIHFPQPQKELALTWLTENLPDQSNHALALSLAHGAPLAAKQLIKDDVLAERINLFEILHALSLKQANPIKSAANIHDMDTLQILDFILSWIIDLLRLHLGANTSEITNQDFIQKLTDLQARTALKNIVQYMNDLQKLRGQIYSGMNLNKQLLVESMLINWMGCA